MMVLIINLSIWVSELLINSEIVKEEDKDIYQYGLELLISTDINVAMVMTIGIFFHKTLQTILFLLEYCFVKRYAGGYHASTYARCIITFSVLYASMLFGFEAFNINRINMSAGFICTISILLVFVLAPVEDKNKPLESEERRLYSLRSKQFLVLGVLINIILYLFIGNKNSLVLFAVSAQIWVGAAVLAGYLKNKAGDPYDNGSDL
jgi:accessory gene regulator B